MGKMTVSQQIKIFLFKNVPSSDGVIQCKPDIKFELESELRELETILKKTSNSL